MTSAQPTFHIHNLGCRVNRVEADSLAAALIAAGARQTEASAADVCILNTCTVTGEAAAKARKGVRRLLSMNPACPVVVTGCAVAMEPDVYRGIDGRVRVVEDRSQLTDEVCALLGLAGSACTTFSRSGDGFMSRAGIKVQDGCPAACTYCIVHLARGPLWSRPVPHIVDEVRAAAAAGIHEVVLTGVNLGSFVYAPSPSSVADPTASGISDRTFRGTDLDGLLETLLGLPCVDGTEQGVRIRLSSLEPMDADDRLIELIAASEGRICAHLHLPLQSGDDAVLARMARPYDTSAYRDRVSRLRAAIPGISLSTDVIAGFPGETDAQAAATLAFCEEMGFSKMHVFRYSRRPGTPAATMADQVPPELIAERAAALRALGARLRVADAAARVGKVERAIVEEGSCCTESYHEALLADEADVRVGDLVTVHIDAFDGERLRVSRVDAGSPDSLRGCAGEGTASAGVPTAAVVSWGRCGGVGR